MYNGDKARKDSLINYGFRLPSAYDNRPLKFEEFEDRINQVVFVSATPADYEKEHAKDNVVEQIIRPTGLLDPKIEVKPVTNQVDDLIEQIRIRVEKKERVLVTTLTKGLDIPEVSLVAILDADKEGFLRSERSLIQTIGRAARNTDGTVIMYADVLTESMEKAISETNRRRKIQTEYNEKTELLQKQ